MIDAIFETWICVILAISMINRFVKNLSPDQFSVSNQILGYWARSLKKILN